MIKRSVNNDTREEVLVATYKCPDGLDWGQIGLCLEMDGYRIPRFPRGCASPNFVELQDAFRRADYHLLNIKQTPCDGDGGVNVVIRFRSLYLRTPVVPRAEVRISDAAEAMRSLASSAQGAAASTEQMSSAISRIATSNNSENYRAFVEQMQREAFYGMGIPEHMGGGPLYGRHSPVFTDTPAITPSPAPKQKLVSPFSIELGQRSIEV